MTLRRLIIGSCLLCVIGSAAFVLAIPTLRAIELQSRIDRDLSKYEHSNSSELYTYYPELIDQIVANKELSTRLTSLHLTVSDFKNLNFASCTKLPNLTHLEVTYAHNTDLLLPTLNALPNLRTAMFAYCRPIEKWVLGLDNQGLRNLHLHEYHSEAISQQTLDILASRMPECKIRLTSD